MNFISAGISAKRHGESLFRYSSVHYMGTYYLAQAVGFTPSDALYLAVNTQGPDIAGGFHHKSQSGKQIIDYRMYRDFYDLRYCDEGGECQYISAFNGFHRLTKMNEGGGLYHQIIPYRPQHELGTGKRGSVRSGLNPDLEDFVHESLLHNLRNWAFEDGEKICTAGLSRFVVGTGSRQQCFGEGPGEPKLAESRFPIVSFAGPLGFVDFSIGLPVKVMLGEQIIHEDPVSRVRYLSSEAGKIIKDKRSRILAKSGVFFHSLQDSASHHHCGSDPDTYISLNMNPMKLEVSFSPHCTLLGSHIIMHQLEVGVPDFLLKKDNKTVYHALKNTLEQLIRLKKMLDSYSNSLSSLEKESLIESIWLALQLKSPVERSFVLHRFMKLRQLIPPPGFNDRETLEDHPPKIISKL